jgi:thiol-disulfide isomerase/thioredoxin
VDEAHFFALSAKYKLFRKLLINHSGIKWQIVKMFKSLKIIIATSLLFLTPALAQNNSPHLSALNGAQIVSQNAYLNAAGFAGRRVLVMFWKYECAPCRVEMVNFNSIRRAVGNIPIILVVPKFTNLEMGAMRPAFENGAIVAVKNNYLQTLGIMGDAEGGVPYSLMFDETGIACIANLGPTDAKTAQNMKNSCN